MHIHFNEHSSYSWKKEHHYPFFGYLQWSKSPFQNWITCKVVLIFTKKTFNYQTSRFIICVFVMIKVAIPKLDQRYAILIENHHVHGKNNLSNITIYYLYICNDQMMKLLLFLFNSNHMYGNFLFSILTMHFFNNCDDEFHHCKLGSRFYHVNEQSSYY